MNQKKISAVSFDLWETLIKDSSRMAEKRSEYRINEIYEILSKINSNITLENIKNSLNYIRERCTQDHNKELDINFDERVIQLIEKISNKEKINLTKNIPISIGKIIDEAFLKFPPEIIHGAEEVIKNIYKKGYKICLISNTGFTSPKTYKIYLEKIGLLKYFQFILLSNELEMAKPSKNIFEIAVKKLSVPAQEILHIGDNYTADILGSKKCEFNSIWIDNEYNEVSAWSHNESKPQNKNFTIKNITEINNLIKL